MNKQTIALDQYLRLGGRFSKIDLSKAKSTYGDKNKDKSIVSITFSHHGSAADIYHVVFKDGTSHNYALSWISVEVEFVLDQKYVNP